MDHPEGGSSVRALWSATVQDDATVALREAQAYYPNCNFARSAGAAPIHRGEPGYRTEMDGDGDGIACEPYRGI
jgi:hypothetical protein